MHVPRRQLWNHQIAGNRKSDSRYSGGGTWTYGYLNRMTASPSLDGTGATTWGYSNDILGNRTDRNFSNSNAAAAKYSWDPLSRMETLYRPSAGASYYYRADGMRVEKVEGATLVWNQPTRTSGHYDTNYASNRPTTRYFHDGQMPMEEDYNPSGSVTKVTRNTLGGRGIDMISVSTETKPFYPLYDGHGNMVARLVKGSTVGTFVTDAWRSYDVWGSVRSGSATGDPTKRYCANLGHQADDESDLIYMRARYYEPGSGRFLSEDTSFAGHNWMIYCDNNPVCKADPSGNSSEALLGLNGLLAGIAYTFLYVAHILVTYCHDPETLVMAAGSAAIGVILMGAAFTLSPGQSVPQKALAAIGALGLGLQAWSFMPMITTMTGGAAAGAKSLAHTAVLLSYGYGLLLLALMLGSNPFNELSHTNFFGEH